ncbi:hypothetical protein [Alteromonas oceanisediminis]|uniref:hypothetical protein n=1 Tax=Alteromonas oceanisediminis TaxID=2836180 RepID=UPI001BD9668A|nr:hypothetical protein [Alteromonas oceanisediminis]MBT0587049.1 hypothetical protein [Alteromonas oceanisediminis]
MKYILILILLTGSIGAVNARMSPVETTLQKRADNSWLLSYSLDIPVFRLGFARNPDDSRMTRWKPVDEQFEIVVNNNKEYLQKKNGRSFSNASVHLTPTYKHLVNDYAPFSPYSDGGTLVYTGRLFACDSECGEDVDLWKITVEVPPEDLIIVNGDILSSSATWLDGNSGQNIYIGLQEPIETSNVVTVIDRKLPDVIQDLLRTEIPRLMNFFENKLGKISGTKPMLFASYANVKGSSSQGGTLPNQIFIHWNLNNFQERINDPNFVYDIIWFFAHEVAHLYQESDGTSLFGTSSALWIHEGNAEWLALKALTAIYPEIEKYSSQKVNRYINECSKGLESTTLFNAVSVGRSDLHYKCGLAIHKAIDETLGNDRERDIFTFWIEYRNRIRNGKEKGMNTFLDVVENWASLSLRQEIDQVIHAHTERSVIL